MLERADPSLINQDLAPVPREQRRWTVLSMASLWIGMVVCVPTYTLASTLIQQGMDCAQAIVTVLLGNLIVLVPMVLIGHAGARYGVPFPVLARAAFGVRGAHVPSVLRALVACGWFGIQTWFGGFAVYQLLNPLFGNALSGPPLPLLGINAGQVGCFVLFWAVQLLIIWKGVESIRVFEVWSAPFLIAMGLVLLGWAYSKAHGFGDMLSAKSQFAPGGAREGQFWRVFFPSLTAMVGFWSTLSLNIPDFTRYARDQRAQVLGQAIGLPLTMTLFAFIGVAVTSATVTIYGEPIWDPIVLLGRMQGGFAVALSLFALSIATLTTNIAANVVSPANAFVNAAPQRITFRMGGCITAGLGIAMMPWKLLESAEQYVYAWLIGYSALLGPIAGILIADYFVVRRTRLDLEGLYRVDGPYAYRRGVNPVALLALVLGVAPSVPGFLHQVQVVASVPAWLDTAYSYAWFVGFALAALVYLAGTRMAGGGAARAPARAA